MSDAKSQLNRQLLGLEPRLQIYFPSLFYLLLSTPHPFITQTSVGQIHLRQTFKVSFGSMC